MDIIERCKREADQAVKDYLQHLQDQAAETCPSEETTQNSQNKLITEVVPSETIEDPQTKQQKDPQQNYEQEQYHFFVKQNTSKQSKCIVCRKVNPKYRCPKCNVEYCCVEHYQSHNLFCTQKFFKEQVERKLKATMVGKADKEKMVEMLTSNQQEMSLDQTQREAETKLEEISEDRLQSLLNLIERGSDVNLTKEQAVSFEAYLKQIQLTAEDNSGLKVGEGVKQAKEQGDSSDLFEEYKPFWSIQQGLSYYFTFEQPMALEDYAQSKHKELIDYRQLTSQLLRNNLCKLTENINFRKTSVFVNVDLFQTVYLTALLFRTFNGQYIKNQQFSSTFLTIYDQSLSQMVSQAYPSALLEAIKDNHSILGLIKTNIAKVGPVNQNILDIMQSWISTSLKDSQDIIQNKHLCLQTLFRLLECLRSVSMQQQTKWSDEVMIAESERSQLTREQKRRERLIMKTIKKLQFLMCYVNEVVYKEALSGEVPPIRSQSNIKILQQMLIVQLQSQRTLQNQQKTFQQQSQMYKQKKLNSILLP